MKLRDFSDKIRCFIFSRFGIGLIIVLLLLLFISGKFLILSLMLTFTLILILYSDFKSIIRIRNDIEKAREINERIDSIQSTIFYKVSFPIMFLSEAGEIVWYNKEIKKIINDKIILKKNIKDIIKEINVKFIIEGKKTEYNNICFNNKFYNISINVINDKNSCEGNSLIMMSFYDITENIRLRKMVDETRESVILIEVDNLEDVIKTTDEALRPQLIADIDRTINNYATSLKALITKYSLNKYILVTKDINLEGEIERKFDILDITREINTGNKLTVTLSIGIGRGGDNPVENHEFAITAQELALGRGGDQCVIKSYEKVSFYGGKTKEVEKKTKVRARVIGHALVELVNESSNVFIMGHHNPDMDCIGAAIGMYSTIKALNKECYIVLGKQHDAVNYIIDKLGEKEEYNKTFIDPASINNIKNDKSLLILVDVHNEGYVLSMDIVKSIDRMVIIDHHRKAKDFIPGAILSYIEPYASSTSELITELIQYMIEKPKLKEIEAVALLAGICLDTKNFCFKTGVRTFEAAAFLRRQGADTVDVKRIFSEELDVYITRSEIIRTAKLKEGIAIAKCPPNLSNLVLAAQAADELLNITGIQASFVIAKIEEDTYISGRSLGDINVQVILEDLGGGGHLTMAAAKIKCVSIDEAEELLNKSIEKYLRKGD